MIESAYDLLDCPCVPLASDEEAIATLGAAIASKAGGYAVAINAEKILFYRRLPNVREVIDRSALPYPDGFGAVLALKWLHGVRARKINMPVACLSGAQANGWRLFLLGAAEDVSVAAYEEILRRYPGIDVVGRMHGFHEPQTYVDSIRQAKPDLVMVALGSPRQEIFAHKLVHEVPGIFVAGCGGAFDILAGRVKRAPAFMVEHGLEWLYRLVRQPARWQRQKFLPLFLLALAGMRLRKFGARGSAVTPQR